MGLKQNLDVHLSHGVMNGSENNSIYPVVVETFIVNQKTKLFIGLKSLTLRLLLRASIQLFPYHNSKTEGNAFPHCP